MDGQSWAKSFSVTIPVAANDLRWARRLLIPAARVEKWCQGLIMVPNRWEPLTDWLDPEVATARLHTLPWGLYRLVDRPTGRWMELLATGTGHYLKRTDGRSWIEDRPLPAGWP
jgi:hypothetical protein